MARSLLSTGDIQYTRDSQAEGFPTTIEIRRAENAQDIVGGLTQTFSNVYQDVPARLMSDKRGFATEERPVGERRTEVAEWNLSVAHDQELDERDQVVHDGVVYEVKSINAGASYLTAKRVKLVRIE
tara:strand:+ start:718 stop:1098 length:381 start_codon:yes stop_codon:yes gene_type:complete